MAGRNVTVKAFAETIQVFEDALQEIRAQCLFHWLGLQDAAWPLFEQWQIMGKLQAFLPFPVTTFMGCYVHLLKNTNFSAKELMEILRLCTEEGEKAFWRRKVEFLEHNARPGKIQDPVSVPTIDLSIYDQLIQKGGSPCKIQV